MSLEQTSKIGNPHRDSMTPPSLLVVVSQKGQSLIAKSSSALKYCIKRDIMCILHTCRSSTRAKESRGRWRTICATRTLNFWRYCTGAPRLIHSSLKSFLMKACSSKLNGRRDVTVLSIYACAARAFLGNERDWNRLEVLLFVSASRAEISYGWWRLMCSNNLVYPDTVWEHSSCINSTSTVPWVVQWDWRRPKPIYLLSECFKY